MKKSESSRWKKRIVPDTELHFSLKFLKIKVKNVNRIGFKMKPFNLNLGKRKGSAPRKSIQNYQK
jgi:hypothetical protein